MQLRSRKITDRWSQLGEGSQVPLSDSSKSTARDKQDSVDTTGARAAWWRWLVDRDAASHDPRPVGDWCRTQPAWLLMSQTHRPPTLPRLHNAVLVDQPGISWMSLRVANVVRFQFHLSLSAITSFRCRRLFLNARLTRLSVIDISTELNNLVSCARSKRWLVINCPI